MACLTDRARAAGHGGVNSDEAPFMRAASCDPGDFVPRHERARERGVADIAFRVPVEVGAAQPNGPYLHEGFTRLRDRLLLLRDA